MASYDGLLKACARGDITYTEVSKLSGLTANTTELNILDGVTATTTELNIMDGVTATTTELNVLDGVTANTTEINKLDGVTASTTELNVLDGVTANTTEINYLDGAAGVVVAGAAAGYKIARGSVTLDGSNPTSVSHGLNTVVAHCVSIDSTLAPNDPSVVTSAVNGSTLNIYAWKPTSAATTTLVASAVTDVNVEWVAVGT